MTGMMKKYMSVALPSFPNYEKQEPQIRRTKIYLKYVNYFTDFCESDGGDLAIVFQNIVEFEKYETAAMLGKLVTSSSKVLEVTSQNYCHIGAYLAISDKFNFPEWFSIQCNK